MTQALIATCVGGRRAGYVQIAPPPQAKAPVGGADYTALEIEAIEAVIEHGTAKRAAAVLGVNHKTVEARIGRAYAKAGVNHIAQLVAAYVTAQLKGQ